LVSRTCHRSFSILVTESFKKEREQREERAFIPSPAAET
jgi:hypothetical protein